MGNSASALPFSIENQVGSDDYGWNIHQGTKKSDKSAVTVFVGKKPALAKTPADKSGRNRGMMQLQPAMHHFQHCKRVRHPHILEVHATLDTDNPEADASAAVDSKNIQGDLIIVTEPCVSLQTWLQTDHPTEEQLAWGLQSMVQALHFLHNSANLAHGLVCPSSFYVNRAGDVKLWNFSLVTPVGKDVGPDRHFREWDGVLCPPTYRSQERVEQRWEAIQAAGVHAMDSYSLGILIGNYYQAAGHSSIPGPLQKAVQRLQTPNLRMRPRLQPLLKCPVFSSPYQTLQQQLSDVTVQPVEQKISFWQNLGNQMTSTGPNSGVVDQNMAEYKILPLIHNTIITICSSEPMLAQDLYRREVLAVMIPLFFIAENYLTGEKLNKELKPLIGLLFQVKDRGVRGTLLQKMTLLSANLDSNTLNSKVFEPMCSGFSDSSAVLRELTLKSTLSLVPNLTAPNLEKLTRYLIRLQSDTEVSIRTNTVIFVSKLAPHLSPISREKLIQPAFVRAMNDSFAPCRLAALQCMVGTKEYFGPQGLATKLLPSITPHMLDPDANVRKEAFAVSETLLVTLKSESEKMREKEEAQLKKQEQQQAAQGQAAAPREDSSATASSYLSGFTSWMASSAQPTTETKPITQTQPMRPQFPPTNVASPPPQSQQPPGLPQAPISAPLQLPSHSQVPAPVADDGWDDVDGLGDDDGANGGWGDDVLDISAKEEDPFASIGMKSVAPKSVGASKLNVGRGGGKKLVVPVKKTSAPVVAVKKLSIKDDEIADGWDDF